MNGLVIGPGPLGPLNTALVIRPSCVSHAPDETGELRLLSIEH